MASVIRSNYAPLLVAGANRGGHGAHHWMYDKSAATASEMARWSLLLLEADHAANKRSEWRWRERYMAMSHRSMVVWYGFTWLALGSGNEHGNRHRRGRDWPTREVGANYFPKGKAREKRRTNVVYQTHAWKNTTLYHRSIDASPQKRDHVLLS